MGGGSRGKGSYGWASREEKGSVEGEGKEEG